MGTNFYIRGHRNDADDMDPETHIGRRSAAGMYCWDCNMTLCKDGTSRVHLGRSAWHECCPSCGQKPQDESLKQSSAGRELGFNRTVPKAKTGVAGCASFSWAMKPKDFHPPESSQCPHCNASWLDPDKWIEDEYGHLYSLDEFNQMLEECPIQYRESIGLFFVKAGRESNSRQLSARELITVNQPTDPTTPARPKFLGLQPIIRGDPIPLYTDPLTQSTFAVYEGQTVDEAMVEHRRLWNAKEKLPDEKR